MTETYEQYRKRRDREFAEKMAKEIRDAKSQWPSPESFLPIISDDGRVLVEANDLDNILNPKAVYPADIVGDYDADTFISHDEFARRCKTRRELGKDVSDEDLRRMPIPLQNLTVGCYFDIFDKLTGEEAEIAWERLYDDFKREHAAELAVRRELRDKKIGINLPLPNY